MKELRRKIMTLDKTDKLPTVPNVLAIRKAEFNYLIINLPLLLTCGQNFPSIIRTYQVKLLTF